MLIACVILMMIDAIFAISHFIFQRVWITITWSITAQTLKILTDAYTSRIVRGQSTLKDVIEQ